MIQTTSPSYILLASLDMARSFIATRGESILDEVLDSLEKAREDIGALPGIEVLGKEIIGSAEIADYEPTRLVISALRLGLKGYDLFNILRERYSIECEFADWNCCVCVAGLGTKPVHTQQLVSALAEVSERSFPLVQRPSLTRISEQNEGQEEPPAGQKGPSPLSPPPPPLSLSPREAWFAKKESVPFKAAVGRISAEMIVPYPPGVPVLCPGEVITEEIVDFLSEQKRAGRHVHMASGDKLETISTVK